MRAEWIQVLADDINLEGMLTAFGGFVELRPDHSVEVNLGAVGDAAAGQLELSAAELNQIDASYLRIGGETTEAKSRI